MPDDFSARKARASAWLAELRNAICAAFQA
jgi:hypothetical protein